MQFSGFCPQKGQIILKCLLSHKLRIIMMPSDLLVQSDLLIQSDLLLAVFCSKQILKNDYIFLHKSLMS